MQGNKPKGYIGSIEGVTVMHIISPTDTREHNEIFEECWCYEQANN